MNNFTGNIFDENGDYVMDATILDNLEITEETVLCDFEDTYEVQQPSKCNETYLFNDSELEDLDYDPNGEFDFDAVQDDDLDYATNNFLERNISIFECFYEDLADFNLLNLALTEQQSKKRKRE